MKRSDEAHAFATGAFAHGSIGSRPDADLVAPRQAEQNLARLTIPAATAAPLLRFAFGILLFLVALSVIFDLCLYGDGAFFAFGLGTPDPWIHTWANYPTRVTAYAVTILPAHLMAKASGQIWWGIKAYGLIWGLIPIAGL